MNSSHATSVPFKTWIGVTIPITTFCPVPALKVYKSHFFRSFLVGITIQEAALGHTRNYIECLHILGLFFSLVTSWTYFNLQIYDKTLQFNHKYFFFCCIFLQDFNKKSKVHTYTRIWDDNHEILGYFSSFIHIKYAFTYIYMYSDIEMEWWWY